MQATRFTGGYDWEDDIDVLNIVKQSVNIIEPLKNIKISNVIVKHEQSNIQALGGICLEYCVNAFIDNCNVYRSHLPAYWISFCNQVLENRCNAYNPQFTNGGQGYNTQCLGSQDIVIQNGIGKNCRHLVDFSGGAYLTALNMRHINNLTNTNLNDTTNNFDCHGMGEHTILFSNCNGSYAFGNGLSQFPELTDNIRIENSEVKKIIGSGTRHLKIDNCNIVFDCNNAILVNEMILNNSTILLDSSNYVDIRGYKRNNLDNSILVINNCSVKYLDLGNFYNVSDNQLRFVDFDIINISSVRFDKNNPINSIYGCSYFRLIDSFINGTVRFRTDKVANIGGNIFIVKLRGMQSLYIDNFGLSDTNNINIYNNTFNFFSAGSLLKSNSQGETTLNVVLRFDKNNILANGNEVDYYIQSCSNLTWNIIDRDNWADSNLVKLGASYELFSDGIIN